MAKLLIVDNEKVIVDGLVVYFTDLKMDGLEVYGVNSGKEAIQLLERTKIDVILSDIRMPSMSGLELQSEVGLRWPRCKIIFLSGYDDFEFVQQAVRGGASNYILKTEGYEVIARSVAEVLAQQLESSRFEQLFAESRQQLIASLPLMRKELLCEILLGDPSSLNTRTKQFNQLQIKLDSEAKVLLVIARVDDWRGISAPSDRTLLLYSIQNIADEYLNTFVQHYSCSYESSRMVWFIQPKPTLDAGERAELERRSLLFVQHSIEDIQLTCRNLLKITLSFAVGGSLVGWSHTQEQFEALKLLLNVGLGTYQEVIMLEAHSLVAVNKSENSAAIKHSISYLVHKLQNYLENGERNEFYTLLAEVLRLPDSSKPELDSTKMEIALSLGGVFLSAINRWGLYQETVKTLNMDILFRMDVRRGWKEYRDYFNQLADVLFASKSSKREDQVNDIVEKIQTYVVEHLDGDLSMTRIGSVFGHHPYYLSRLYKQMTKVSLQDYITNTRLDKAKQLLRNSELRIQDISKAVGFLSEGYFYRFFKKTVGLTPNDFRELPKL
ncbi:response regulator transcription factor [Paenibacillus sinopodophylli]|uniref:response regulator transcription factor n=1 Tax=Paenibacillus sinopodophylli TaxID=1837342 RepID=UPI00110CCE87|nr:response regulator [Paenibacillus sinopodophylli]